MNKPGRNDPCACGSGKKHKKCCLLTAQNAEFEYRRWRQIEAGLIPRLTAFALTSLGEEVREEAWREFNGDDCVAGHDPRSAMNMVFMPWLLFTWTFEVDPTGSAQFSETTVAELFLNEENNLLSHDERELLLSAIRCPYTLAEAIEVTPGSGMTLLDLFRRTKYKVVERSASQALKRGEIIYCATTELAGIRSNIGTSPYALPPTAKRDVLELRKWIVGEIGTEEITAAHLHEFEPDIRGLYLDILKGMFTPPTLANTDGDRFVPQKVFFDIESVDEAFQKLKGLAEGESETDLLKDATIEDGLVVKAEISWLGGSSEARKRLGGPVLLGLLKIDQGRLVAEVNSIQRADIVKRLIEERLGGSAKYKITLIEPIESQIQEMWQAAAAGEPGWSPKRKPQNNEPSISLDDASPELRALMEERARQYWVSWFDLPVPALNDMTPREAAKTDEGRDLLESLLLLYESYRDRESDNISAMDIPYLRRELGMD